MENQFPALETQKNSQRTLAFQTLFLQLHKFGLKTFINFSVQRVVFQFKAFRSQKF